MNLLSPIDRVIPNVRWLMFAVGCCLPWLSLDASCRALAAVGDEERTELSELADYRQPVDLSLSPDEKRLAVACKKTGAILVVDVDRSEIVQQLKIGDELADLEPVGRDRIACVDNKRNQVVICQWLEGRLVQVQSFETSMSPVRAEWVPSASTLRVACLWSRRVESFLIDTEFKTATKVSSWDLAIAPRAMRTIPERDVTIIADAFTPEVKLLRSSDGSPLGSLSMYGHAITNIERDGTDKIALLHPMLNDFAQTNQNDIHWGVLMANDLRWLRIDNLLEKKGDDVYVGGRVHPVGVPGNGAAEPTSFALSNRDYVAVTVGGTNQIAIGRRDGYSFTYVDVGHYPVSCVIASDGIRCFTANQFDDSVAVVDLQHGKLSKKILLGAMRSLTDEERGERLFHSAEFSHDRWMTCASCHVDGHTNGLLNDNLGDRTYGAPKRVLTLLGIRNTQPYSWLGHEATIEKQVARSVLKTMQSYRVIDPDEMEQMAAFCESLPAPPSIRQARGVADDELVRAGRELFVSRNCVDCHTPPMYTSPDVFAVGLQDEKGNKQFNPPSLIGVSQRGPNYFHDNRADNLRAVLRKHPKDMENEKASEAKLSSLSETEMNALVAFLESL